MTNNQTGVGRETKAVKSRDEAKRQLDKDRSKIRRESESFARKVSANLPKK